MTHVISPAPELRIAFQGGQQVMNIQRGSSDALESPAVAAFHLPPKIVDRAVRGLPWIAVIAAVTGLSLMTIKRLLQPEYAATWAHPATRLVAFAITVLSAGLIVVHRNGWLRKERLLDLALFFQVAVAFACAVAENAAYHDPNAVVIGSSCIGVWMLLCGLLIPNAPVRSALAAAFCVMMWPLGNYVDRLIFGHPPMPLSRMLVWVLPLVLVGVWTCIINHYAIRYHIRRQRADDLGSYVLTSRIGNGGMGEVWRAKHKMLARDAAIKLIRPEVLRAGSGRQESLLRRRFEREAQVTASLRSPHTVALYDFGKSRDGSFYYVMELLDGIDLQTLVEQFGPMDPARVIHILQQVCQSLEEAHRAGLIHRDIKPRNILLCKLGLEYDYAKVLDFGLVKSLRPEDQAETLMTIDGVATGTPAYLAPEIAIGNHEIDGRADLYSLGCVAYFLLTGRMVFEEKSPVAFAMAHVGTAPVPVGRRTELSIPAGLEDVVMQLLEKDPADRIQTAADLARRLRALRHLAPWCPDRAEDWWDLNQPAITARAEDRDTASLPGRVMPDYAHT